jgi:pyruvate,orthophosphate dikinase
MYGDVVMGMKPESKDEEDPFETVWKSSKKKKITKDTEMTTEILKELTQRYKKLIKERTKKDFPTDPMEQLWGAINAVFGSWWANVPLFTAKKKAFLATGALPLMFRPWLCNMGDDCANGVAFTRNPATGENAFYGEYLINAQGEDVVAGIRTPQRSQSRAQKSGPKITT